MSPRTACVIATALAAATAHADELEVAHDQPIEELAHRVDVRITDGVATYTVQRQLRNRGRRADELKLTIELPSGAAATGMRVLANGAWRGAELLDGDVAAARYGQVAGVGESEPSDAALLAWVASNQLALYIAPLAPGATSTVEYTLTVPVRYSGGRHWVTYPRAEPAPRRALHRFVDPIVTVHAAPGSAATAATTTIIRRREPAAPAGASTIHVPASHAALRLHATARISYAVEHALRDELSVALVTPSGARIPVDGDAIELPKPERAAGRWQLAVSDAGAEPGVLAHWTLTIGGATYRADTPAIIPGDHETSAALALVGVPAPPIATWSARLGRVVASTDHAFARLELDAAPRLSALPVGAQVVFVLDASYSAGEPHLEAQLAIARAYLSHVPDAHVEIIAVRRAAQRLFGRFVPARDADRHLDAAIRRGALALGNGSELHAGAALAASILAGRPGPHRVVIATDELVRASDDGTAALAALGALAPSAIVHVISPGGEDGGLAELARDDDAELAPLAQRHHGIFARLETVPAPLRELAPIVLELVRPTRIENLAGPAGFELPTELREGTGLRIVDATLTAATAPASVTLIGTLWSDPIELAVDTTRAFSTATAAFVLGAGAHERQQLGESEVRTLAFAARAISPLTSYVVAQPGPGATPSLLGPDPNTLAWSTYSTSTMGGSSHCVAGTVTGAARPSPDLRALIDARACVRRHGAGRVKLFVETTRDEIVDVQIHGGAGPLADCIAEAAWVTRLDERFYRERDRFDLEF